MKEVGKRHINTKLVIEELHKAFELINRDYYKGELPLPAILIQSRGKNQKTLGWCTVAKVWVDGNNKDEKYEINIVAEALNRGLLPVITTLMHEMVHLYCRENDIKETSRSHTYHNKKFKEIAEEHGMVCEKKSDSLGWSSARLTPETVNRIYSYNLSEDVFGFGRLDTNGGEKEKKKKKSSTRKYKCPECGTLIRATKDVNVICGDCNVPFELVPDEYIVTVPFRCKDCGQEMEQPVGSTTCIFCGGELEQISKDEPPTEIETRSFNNPIEICCKDCGSIAKVERLEGEGVYICPECGSLHVFDLANPTEELNKFNDEEDAKLIDENGELIDVKQKVLPLPKEDEPVEQYSKNENTGWDEEKVRAVMRDTADILNKEGYELNVDEIPVIIKKLKPYGKCCWEFEKTRGRGADKLVTTKIEFSARHLEEDSDFDIADTIKHEVVHAWVNGLKGKDQGHNDLFKRYAEKVGAIPRATKEAHKIKNVWGAKYFKRT